MQSLRGRGVTSTYLYPYRLHHRKALEKSEETDVQGRESGDDVHDHADGSNVDVDEGVTNVALRMG